MNKQKQKEPLSLRIAKIILAVVITTGLGTIIIGGGVVIMKYYNSEVNNNKIIQPVTNEIVDFKVKGYSQTFSYESASMAMDCGFIDGKIVSGEFQGKELIVFLPNHTTEKYPKEGEIIKIFITNKKVVLRNKFDEVYKREFPYYCLEDKEMDGEKKNDYAFQEIFAFKIPNEKNQNAVLLQSAEILGISLPIEIKEIVYYRDGGTIGVVAKDIDNKDFIFCLDGRIREMEIGKELEPYHIYLKATHPTHLNAQEIPIAGEKEKAILYILKDWVDRQVSKEEQIRLLDIRTVNGLSEEELKIYRILKVIKRLEDRNKTIDQPDTSDWQTYRNEKFGFEVKYPEYYSELKYDFDSMTEKDYDRIHLFRYMSEEELNDFKKYHLVAFEEGGTYSGTIFAKLYNDKEELKKWYGIETLKNLELKEFENIDYYIANKLTKHPLKNEQPIIGYNYIVPHYKIDSLFLVFEIPEFLRLKFEKEFLSTFKFIES